MHKLRNDLILIGIIVLVAVLSLILFFTLNTSENLVAYIYYDKELVHTAEIGQKETYEVNGVKIIIDERGVYVLDSNCDDKICVHQGIITMSGQTITCLPNKVFIKLEGKGVDVGI